MSLIRTKYFDYIEGVELDRQMKRKTLPLEET